MFCGAAGLYSKLLQVVKLLPVERPLQEAQLLPQEGLLWVLLLVAFLYHLFQNNCKNNIIILTI